MSQKSAQELQQMIDTLTKNVRDLEARVVQLEHEVRRLKR